MHYTNLPLFTFHKKSTTELCVCLCQLETLAVADFDVERARDIPLWIIIVSVVAGFLLLTLVIILLWKVQRLTPRSHHRLRGSASPVLTSTGFVNGKGQFSTPHRIDTPQPITKKFVTGDYVGDPYGCVKLGAYPSKGGFWAHG